MGRDVHGQANEANEANVMHPLSHTCNNTYTCVHSVCRH